MKRLILICFSILLFFTLSACKGNGNGDEVSVSPSEDIPVTSYEPTAEPSPTETSEPTEDISETDEASPPVTESGRDYYSTLTYEAEGKSVTVDATLVESDLGLGGKLYYSMYVDGTFALVSESGTDTYYPPHPYSSFEPPFFEIKLIDGKDAAELTPSYLDGYIDYTDIEFSGKNKISESGIYAQVSVAINGTSYCEAYLIDVAGGTIAVVLSYPAELSDSHAPLLRAMLYTFELF